MIRAGELRDRLTLRKWTPTSDPGWGSTAGWSDGPTFWASVTPVAATEKLVQQGMQSVLSHRIVARHRTDVTPKDRLVYRDRILEVLGVHDPDGRRRELLIEAREHPQEGGVDV